ncbi:ABC transporter permease [Nanoarchaeota archaeon]
MIKLLELIKKNFKLLVRAKISALIIFIGPILLVSLLGLAYSQSSTFTLSASVYSGAYSDLSESLITKMTNQNFRVTKRDSIENCIGSVKHGESQSCIIFPSDMQVKEDKTNEITFYVDYSQINLVWLMLDVMSARVSERSEEISKELTGDILNRMWFVEERIKASDSRLTTIKSASDNLNSASGDIQSNFKKLDISVDFSNIDIEGSKAKAGNISIILDSIKARVGSLSSDIQSDINSIEGSVANIEDDVNDSSIMSELDDIDNAADDIVDSIENVTAAINNKTDNASAQIIIVKQEFDKISQKIAETNTKINSVKKKRDDLLPEFDNMASGISTMLGDIDTLQGTLDEALQKILSVKGKSAEGIVTPISTKIEPISAQKTHFNTLFPTLLVLIMMITGILLAETLVMVEKKSKAFFRNNFTPTSYFTFNISTYITSLVVIIIQLLLFVSVSAFFFETEVMTSIWLILLLIFLTATVFICIGMFLGFIFKTEETSNLAAITLITVFLLFSSAVIPLESLPAYLKDIALFNPFVISEIALKQAMLFHFSFSKLMGSLSFLAAYALGIFALMIILQNVLHKLSFMQLSRLHLGRKAVVREKRGDVKLTSEQPKKHDINELAVNNEPKKPAKEPAKTGKNTPEGIKAMKTGPKKPAKEPAKAGNKPSEEPKTQAPGVQASNPVSRLFYKFRKK